MERHRNPSPETRLAAERRVIDALPASLPLSDSEAAWLLTLFGADDLRFIFEGRTSGEASS